MISLALALWVACLTAPSARAQDLPLEYQVKAAFVMNFFHYIQWPTPFTGPIKIGVTDQSMLAKAVASLDGKTINQHLITVTTLNPSDPVNGYDILIVSQPQRPVPSTTGTLTISEIEGFCENGGIIEFFLSEGKVRFKINPAAAQKSGLKISSKLLRLATLIDTKP